VEKQDNIAQDVQQAALSRETLEQHLRARAWKDDSFRQELLANPKAVLQRDFAAWFPEGKIPSELSIKIVEEEEQSICFVLPPNATENVLHDNNAIEDEELACISGGTNVWGTCYTCHAALTCYTCTCRCNNGASIVSKIRL
jgi:hypothetical protein